MNKLLLYDRRHVCKVFYPLSGRDDHLGMKCLVRIAEQDRNSADRLRNRFAEV
jgi:hypothetical protein